LAQKCWRGQDPIGRRLYRPSSAKDLLAVGPNTKYITVVGVVKEVSVRSLADTERRVGAYYFPRAQSVSHSMALVARTKGDPQALVSEIRAALAKIDPTLPFYQV